MLGAAAVGLLTLVSELYRGHTHAHTHTYTGNVYNVCLQWLFKKDLVHKIYYIMDTIS